MFVNSPMRKRPSRRKVVPNTDISAFNKIFGLSSFPSLSEYFSDCFLKAVERLSVSGAALKLLGTGARSSVSKGRLEPSLSKGFIQVTKIVLNKLLVSFLGTLNSLEGPVLEGRGEVSVKGLAFIFHSSTGGIAVGDSIYRK